MNKYDVPCKTQMLNANVTIDSFIALSRQAVAFCIPSENSLMKSHTEDLKKLVWWTAEAVSHLKRQNFCFDATQI